MPLVHNKLGLVMSDAEAQDRIRQVIARYGRFILNSSVKPHVGEIGFYAGLPLRMVRFVSFEEAKREECLDIWPPGLVPDDEDEYYFEVVVAD